MTAVGETNSPLMTQCLDFCQALALQGMVFKFSVSVGSTFNFSMDTMKGKDFPASRSKKRSSPSTLKRNAKRQEEFLKKKTSSEAVTSTGMETNQKKDKAFQCDQCDATFKTENGLKIHIGKSHKEALSPEKIRKPSSQSSLTVSPIRDQSRVEPCHNCGMDMSPSHQCNFYQDSTLGGGPELKESATCPGALNGRVDCGCVKWNQLCLYRTPDFMRKSVPK